MNRLLSILALLLFLDPIRAAAEPFPLSGGALDSSSSRDPIVVVHDDTRFVAAWEAEGRIESAWGATREELTGGSVFVSPVSIPANLALVSSPAGTLLLWTDQGALRGSLLVGETWIPLAIEYELLPAYGLDVAWDGESYVLVWSEVRWLRAAKLSTHGMVTDLGVLVDSRTFPVSTRSESFTKPRVTAYPGGFAVVAESTVGSLGADWYETSAVYVRAGEGGRAERLIRDFSPPREVAARSPEATPVDITSRNGVPVVVAGDGERILVVKDPGSPAESQSVIARSRAFEVRIEALPNGYAVRWFHYGRMFSVPLDESAAPIGPIRVVEAAAFQIHEPNSTLDRWPLDIAQNGGETLAVFRWKSSDHGEDRFYPAAEFFPEGGVHPTPVLAVPSPAATTMLEPRRWLVTWAAVSGATEYVVQWKFETGGWLTYTVAGETSVELVWPVYSGAPIAIRVFAMNLGLMSEPAVALRDASRRRLVRR